jgi:hypothetical protein
VAPPEMALSRSRKHYCRIQFLAPCPGHDLHNRHHKSWWSAIFGPQPSLATGPTPTLAISLLSTPARRSVKNDDYKDDHTQKIDTLIEMIKDTGSQKIHK